MTLPDLNNIIFFLAAASVLIVIPGPAILYIVAKSMEQGYKAGFASVLGISVGGLVHVTAAAIGISSILVASATAFSVIKYLGALYLIYLGIKKLMDKSAENQGNFIHSKNKKLSKIFYEAVWVNVLNPKTAIFFFAFLPQFINIEKGGNAFQIFFLGMLFTGLAMYSDALYVLLSVKISKLLTNSQKFLKSQKYISGFTYIMLGLITLGISQPETGTANNK